MPFSRSTRTDRRRRAIRESSVSQNTVGSDSLRRAHRKRTESDSDDSAANALRRDPGYSQNVRRACQQRFMQLIPIRRSSLILVISTVWMVWALLLAGHYLIHVRDQAWSQLPIASLFHIRNRDSIAHWLGTQLWMITALTATLIFQLRRHKMDDYRAKYRIWLIYVFAAIACSLDASSSALYRLGWSIDGWARAEIGYSGWSVVFVSFASIVAVLALRLCTELKVAPLSVTFWLFGLFAWGVGAILGTGLIRTNLPQSQLDMFVGGAWLGGILAVWISAGVYLRHIYIQAQRRFVLREGLIRESRSLRMPSFKWSRREATAADTDSSAETGELSTSFARRWLRVPSFRRSVTGEVSQSTGKAIQEKSSNKKSRREAIAEDAVEIKPNVATSSNRTRQELEDDENELDEQVEVQDKQTTANVPNERKAGWSSWLGRDQIAKQSNESNPTQDRIVAKEDRKSSYASNEKASHSRAEDLASEAKPSWWKRKSPLKDDSEVNEKKLKTDTAVRPKKNVEEDMTRVSLKHRLAFWKRQGKAGLATVKTIASADKANATAEKRNEASKDKTTAAKPARGLGNWMPKRTDAVDSDAMKTKSTAPLQKAETEKKSFWSRKEIAAVTVKADDDKKDKPKKRMFGMFDGLKLKPPVETTGMKQQPTPVAVNASRPLPTTASNAANSTEDDEADDGDRNLTRAERRRLRREQGQNRKAA
jgi:hypothetical protein